MIEQSESRRLLWTAHGVRVGSGGKGLKRGGDAELIAARVDEPATLRWFLGRGVMRPEGAGGGKNGSAAEIEIVRADGSKETFATLEGTVDLSIGDEVRLQAAGGGAWGEPPSDPES
jgi:N-methylhydantoinase B/oxoprolinase/acetone carboxylase alpha subunit